MTLSSVPGRSKQKKPSSMKCERIETPHVESRWDVLAEIIAGHFRPVHTVVAEADTCDSFLFGRATSSGQFEAMRQDSVGSFAEEVEKPRRPFRLHAVTFSAMG